MVLKALIKKILPEDSVTFLRAMRMSKDASYCNDGLITIHDSDFLSNKTFLEAYQKGKQTGSWGTQDIQWRVYIACWAAEKAKSLPGDFVECGVNRGGLSRAVMHYINFVELKHKKFFLLDTFCGIPEKYIAQASEANLSDYQECYASVRETFKSFSNVEIIRGIVPETLTKVTSSKICYLSIDMNSAEPEIEAIEYFWEKLVSGAVVILDDYGFDKKSYYRQKEAFDYFSLSKNVPILLLPTGQGLIFKP
jgi:O-methyltransferase